MPDTATRYVFDTDFAAEDERLALGERLWDPGSRAALAALGPAAGWRCLEVGAGRGSIAAWLHERVGPAGEVVAVDLRTDRLAGVAARGVRVAALDVTAADPPGGPYDLVHARLVVAHLADRAAVVARLARVLRPGGRLMLEDTDVASLFRHAHQGDLHPRVRAAAYAVMGAAGHHPGCGLLDGELVEAAGLIDVRADGRAVVVRGGSPQARWYQLWLAHLRGRMVGTSLVGDAEIDAALTDLRDPAHRWLSQVMVTTVGRSAEKETA